jgi:hypothetical protein
MFGVISLVLDTVRRALRAPGTAVLLALGLLAGWAGFALAILALGEAESQAGEVVAGTASAWAALLTLQALARVLDQDAAAALTPAVDATAPGLLGRLLGRWGGSILVGLGGSAALGTALIAFSPAPWAGLLSLYSTTLSTALLAGSWGLVLGVLAGPRAILGGGLLLWVLGHVPWRAASLLPGPLAEHAALTALGLVCVALARAGHTAACG